MISMSLIVQLVIGSLVFYVLYWALQKIAPPEPVNKILFVLLILVLVVWLLNLLLPLMGGPRLFRY